MGKLGLRLNRWNSAPVTSIPAITFEPEISTYISGLNTPLSPGQISRLDAFVKSLKSSLQISLLSDAFDIMYIFAGETSESSLRNIVKDAHHATPVNAPAFTQFRGFAGNGSNAYINTQFNPSIQGVNYTLNSAAIGLFSNTNIGGTTLDMGARSGTTSNRIVLLPRFNDTFIGHINTNSTLAGAANLSSTGLFAMRRTASNEQANHINGLNVKQDIYSSSNLPNTNITIGAMNTNGVISGYTTRQYAFAFASRGLSDAENAAVKNAISNYLDNYYLTANILYSGSSTMTNYTGDAIATLVNTLGIETDISGNANTIANQLAAYIALSATTKILIDKVFLMIGGNDMQPATSADSKINELRNYIAAIKSGSPRAKVYLATLHPFKQRLIDLYGATGGLVSYQKWLDYNHAIRGLGGNPITNADYYFDQHTNDLNDGAGNLKSEYDTGDHIHMTTAGKQLIVNTFLSKIITV